MITTANALIDAHAHIIRIKRQLCSGFRETARQMARYSIDRETMERLTTEGIAEAERNDDRPEKK